MHSLTSFCSGSFIASIARFSSFNSSSGAFAYSPFAQTRPPAARISFFSGQMCFQMKLVKNVFSQFVGLYAATGRMISKEKGMTEF